MNDQPDIETLKREAAKGLAGAQYNLGVWYLSAPEPDRDTEAAVKYFNQAADQDFAPALSALGYMTLRAQGVRFDAARAADYFEQAAVSGFAEAQYRLGEMYGVGLGRDRDTLRALQWLTSAATQGHPQALTQQAYCTDQGLGCDPDPPAATQLYLAAAQAGDPRAQCALARRYQIGFTLAPDIELADAWYARAAKTGYPGARLHLAQTGRNPATEIADAGSQMSLSSLPGCVVETLSWSPRVFRLRHFMSQEECFHLMAVAAPFLKPSTVLQRGTGRLSQSPGRRSGSMSFVDPLRDIVVWNIEERLARHSLLPVQNAEPLTMLHYSTGDEYRPHFDYFDPAEPSSKVALCRGGQRVATFMTYLNTVDAGGATEFPEVGLRIPAEAGTAILFFSLRPDGAIDPLTRHAGTPVEAGEKWLATRWIRQAPYSSG